MQDSQYDSLVKMASRASIGVAATMLLIKLYAWYVSSSAAMLASATDALLDLLASSISFLIISFSLTPADAEHRFGHGKAENLGALLQATLIVSSAALLIFHGVERMITPQPILHSKAVIVVSIIAMLATVMLLSLQKYVISRTGSVAIRADSLHYQSDLLLNVGVIVAVLLADYAFAIADGLYAVIVALFLLYGCIGIVKHAVDQLLDHELEAQDIDKIKAILRQHPQSLGFHRLRTRRSGKHRFIECHVELADDISLIQAHGIVTELEQQLVQLFPDCEVLIHVDPVTAVTDKQ
ncbi:cation diffusion facilitator family transporter [Thalassotalea maritima]|uniref:cation diffusion facilitator family transporter n=1 Tax=Thalassotalea maritima TaxID=3242416 RepID=UPI003527F57F